MDSAEKRNVPEFDLADGLALLSAYQADPANVPCPRCGPGYIEIVCYLDFQAVEEARATPVCPVEDYIVVLFCHGCGCTGALDISSN